MSPKQSTPSITSDPGPLLTHTAEPETSRRLAVADLPQHEGGDVRLGNSLQYKEVFDNISACMFIVDVTDDGRFKFVAFNRAEEEVVGLTSAQVAGRFVEELFRPEVAEQIT